jgi:streptomycin 3"-adenylyltransferase
MPQYGWKNCPEITRGQVSRVVSALRSRLEKDLAGIYLHGSLAMGCFNPSVSDVDLLVVIQTGLSVEAQKSIMEELLKHSKAIAPIEVSILRTGDMKPWRSPTPYLLHFSESQREQIQQEIADGVWRCWNDAPKLDKYLAAHVIVARERGVCLYGLTADQVLPAVPPDDYLASILSDLTWLRERLETQPVAAVLNMCRVLAYTREGKILSKDEGGRWAMEKLPNPLLQVVRSAMSVYSGMYPEMYVSPEQVKVFFERVSGEIEKQIHPN